MPLSRKRGSKTELGDYQTPAALAREICALLLEMRIEPACILEPTCGQGSLLLAALEAFPGATRALALDIDPDHIDFLRASLATLHIPPPTRVVCEDFFRADWRTLLSALPDPLLVIGNPPWVTNAELGSLGSTNLPSKSNFQARPGLDALTGKSNFDISEWMIVHLLEELGTRDATIAMLCKTAVARRVMAHTWKNSPRLTSARIHTIDALRHFDAAVDACLLVCRTGPAPHTFDCDVHPSLGEASALTFGYRDGSLVGDLCTYTRWKHLAGKSFLRWRSGIKHDCAKVLELEERDGAVWNGLDERVEIEDTCLFPMLKSSDLASRRTTLPRRRMLVPQTAVNESTTHLRETAPATWRYLEAHSERLDRRASSIYRRRPRFSVFGVGPYTFAPWKVAISAFYKRLDFTLVGPREGKPVVLDDTAYFLPCRTRREAELLAELLASRPAQEFLRAFVFWDAKRPITSELLNRLDLIALARELNLDAELERICVAELSPSSSLERQRPLFPAG